MLRLEGDEDYDYLPGQGADGPGPGIDEAPAQRGRRQSRRPAVTNEEFNPLAAGDDELRAMGITVMSDHSGRV